MLLRIALLIAIVVLRPVAAWAEGADPLSPSVWADFFASKGLAGITALMFIGLVILWRKNESKNDQLVAAGGRIEKTAADITAALKGVEDAQETTGRVNAERWDSVKSMSSDLGKVANGVANNADAIRDVKAGQSEVVRALDSRLGELRLDVQAALRELRERDAARERAEAERNRAEAAARDLRERRP